MQRWLSGLEVLFLIARSRPPEYRTVPTTTKASTEWGIHVWNEWAIKASEAAVAVQTVLQSILRCLRCP